MRPQRRRSFIRGFVEGLALSGDWLLPIAYTLAIFAVGYGFGSGAL